MVIIKTSEIRIYKLWRRAVERKDYIPGFGYGPSIVHLEEH